MGTSVSIDADSLGVALLAKIRKAGFRVTLEDEIKPRIEPLSLLTEKQRELLRQNKDAVQQALFLERNELLRVWYRSVESPPPRRKDLS